MRDVKKGLTLHVQKREKLKPAYSTPRDRSYEAYSEFMLTTMKGMTGKEVTTYDEEKMRRRWKEFWAEEGAVDGE